jgi:hypothetical protein
MTLGSGATSTKYLGTRPMNVTQNSHWWSRSKTEPNPDSEYDPENIENRHIIDTNPTTTIVTATIQQEKKVDHEEGEHLFHS